MARLNRNGGEEGNDDRLPSRPTIAPEHLPEVSQDLINYLNMMFPDTLPPVGSAYTEVERAWGRREVIDHLIRAKDQNEQDNVLRRIDTSSSRGPGTPAASSGR